MFYLWEHEEHKITQKTNLFISLWIFPLSSLSLTFRSFFVKIFFSFCSISAKNLNLLDLFSNWCWLVGTLSQSNCRKIAFGKSANQRPSIWKSALSNATWLNSVTSDINLGSVIFSFGTATTWRSFGGFFFELFIRFVKKY